MVSRSANDTNRRWRTFSTLAIDSTIVIMPVV